MLRSLPFYKEARAKAYTEQNVKSAFRKTGIVPFFPRMILPKKDRTYPVNTVAGTFFPLNKIPYTKCPLRRQTNQALSFVKTASPGQICDLILRFSHTAEYNLTATDIATSEMQRLRAEFKIAKDVKKDRRVISRARVITGADALKAMRKAGEKNKTSGKSS